MKTFKQVKYEDWWYHYLVDHGKEIVEFVSIKNNPWDVTNITNKKIFFPTFSIENRASGECVPCNPTEVVLFRVKYGV